MTLPKATVVVDGDFVVVDIVVVVIALVKIVVVALFVISGHIIFSCGQ